MVIDNICEMIASGEIPNEVYDKYLANTKIGFMRAFEVKEFLLKEIKEYLEEET